MLQERLIHSIDLMSDDTKQGAGGERHLKVAFWLVARQKRLSSASAAAQANSTSSTGCASVERATTAAYASASSAK